MKNLAHIISKVYEQPWLITPAKHRAITRLIESKLTDSMMPAGMTDDDEDPEMGRDGDTAVIPVHGIIGHHLSGLETMCGGCDLGAVGAMIDAAMADDGIQKLLFDFRTPGGTVTGVPELASKIGNINGKKTVAYTDSECCSAGYWLASQCDAFYTSESADVGSIGVYMVLLDESRALENEGIKVNAISAGKYKLSGASFRPLSDEERAMFQAGVDKTYNAFKSAILRKRAIKDSVMQGQVYDGIEACELGLCDGIVNDISELLE